MDLLNLLELFVDKTPPTPHKLTHPPPSPNTPIRKPYHQGTSLLHTGRRLQVLVRARTRNSYDMVRARTL